MKQSVSFNGLTPAGRAKARAKALTVKNLVLTLRAIGKSDEEIIKVLETMRQRRKEGHMPISGV